MNELQLVYLCCAKSYLKHRHTYTHTLLEQLTKKIALVFNSLKFTLIRLWRYKENQIHVAENGDIFCQLQ